MADPVVHITAGIPDSGTGNITTLGQIIIPRTSSVSQASVSCSSSGDNILVTRSVGTIKVYGILLMADSGVGMKFRNGGTDLTGVMQVGSLFLPWQFDPYFTTTGTNNFILNLSSAVQVSGVIYYLDT